jgi:hypothetical protein
MLLFLSHFEQQTKGVAGEIWIWLEKQAGEK